MADFNFDDAAYQYAEGLKAIKLMWLAAHGTLKLRAEEVLNEISEYQRRIDSGGDPIGKWDGPDCIWDEDGKLRVELLSVQEAVIELSCATTIALYHHWERFVPAKQKKYHRRHDDLKRDLLDADVSIHEDIDALWCSANYLKHGRSTWLDRLSADFGDRFPNLPYRRKSEENWVRRIGLGATHIDWFFEIAEQSKRPIFPAI